jgi:predicted nucleotidyltransferase
MKLSTPEERESLLQEELDRVLKIIKEDYDPEKIILFGSLVTKEVHEGSDIDLLIVKKTPKRSIERTLELGRLIRPRVGIDMFIYTPEEFEILQREKFSFLRSVLKNGEVLYEKRG